LSGFEARQERLLARLEERGLSALVVTGAANVRYLTGYVGSNGVAVIGPAGRRLVTDSRYAVSARAETRGVDVVIGRRDLLADVAAAVAEIAPDGTIGVEAEHVSLARHRRVAAALEGRELDPTANLVEDLRVVKDDAEVAAIREAAAMADAAFQAVIAEGLVGRTERDVAFAILRAQIDAGAEEPSFPTIVAAGPRGARPHAVPSAEPIPPDTLVVIDQGAVHRGYCSDMTRTVATGDLPEELERAYAVCLEAQMAAMAAVRPGITAVELDAVARGVIADAGLGEAFGHGLGHGVGLEIHERPAVRPEASETLEAGMVVTIEPGIYLEGLGGVRIEDLVLVTEEGGEALSRSDKELLTISRRIT
jgi:Xaa-Pro aminopeptidase